MDRGRSTSVEGVTFVFAEALLISLLSAIDIGNKDETVDCMLCNSHTPRAERLCYGGTSKCELHRLF